MFAIHFVSILLVVPGASGGTKQKRIIEPNEDTEVDEHPWMALLKDQTGGFCGGVILNRCFILTAAHCFTIGAPINKVILGIHKSHLLDLGIIYKSGSKNNTFTYKIHEDAKFKNNWIPDLALIRLSNPLTYIIDKIEPISVSDEPPQKGWALTTYGWGYHLLSKKGKKQKILKKRADEIQKCSNIDCIIRPEITGLGDSGGPWIIPGKEINGTTEGCLIGLTESSPRYGVDRFTSAAEFVNNGWIKNTMEKMDRKQQDDCSGITHLGTCKPDAKKSNKKDKRQRCTDLTLKDNMVLLSGSLTNNKAGHTVSVACKPFYKVVGSGHFLCTIEGKWRPEFITECIKYMKILPG